MKGATALRQMARILQEDLRPTEDILGELADLLSQGWGSLVVTGVRVRLGDLEACSGRLEAKSWSQSSEFSLGSGKGGDIQIVYRGEPSGDEERDLLLEHQAFLDTVAELLCTYLRRVACLEELREARVKLRTHQRQLGQLASELSLSEARQRRAIAQELHDHIGQALAFIRMRVNRLQGDAVFSGFEGTLLEIRKLVDQAINSTRSLTFEISPPVLYELGLGAAFEWLGDRFGAHQDLSMDVRVERAVDELPEDTRILLFHSVRELLVNVVKHAHALNVWIRAGRRGDRIEVEVEDDGAGFVVDTAQEKETDLMHFGLFSIRERLDYLGGAMSIRSSPGHGTCVTLSIPLKNKNPKRESEWA